MARGPVHRDSFQGCVGLPMPARRRGEESEGMEQETAIDGELRGLEFG
jgi:hypothetical protein